MFYKLEAFTYEGCPVIGNLDTETPYKEKEFFFNTLAEAEAEMNKQIHSGERYLYFLWFFRITSLPLGLDIESYGVARTERIYLRNGTLYAKWPMYDGHNAGFAGRKASDCHFSVGTLVMVFNGVTQPPSFGIVAELPPSPEACSANPGKYDVWDDSYTVLDGEGCLHPYISRTLPLSFALPDERVAHLMSELTEYRQSCCCPEEEEVMPF